MEAHPLGFSVSPTSATRALASLCNCKNKPVMCFCSNSCALTCSVILLCELCWLCCHCCCTETSSFSLSTQLLLITESWGWELRWIYALDLWGKQGRWTWPTSALGQETGTLSWVQSSVWFDAWMITYFYISKTADNAVSYSWFGENPFFFFGLTASCLLLMLSDSTDRLAS